MKYTAIKKVPCPICKGTGKTTIQVGATGDMVAKMRNKKMTMKEIAEKLGIAISVVHYHLNKHK